MKRFFYLIAVVFMASSCLGDGPTYEKSYTLNVNFEYSFDYSQTFGPDSLWIDTVNGVGIGYMDMAFYQKLNADKTELLGGFLVSYQEMPKSPQTDKEESSGQDDLGQDEESSGQDDNVAETVPVDKTWRAYILEPSKTRNTYVVFHDTDEMPEHDVEFLLPDYGTCVMSECYVTNTLAVAEAVASQFETGDKLVVRATGYLGGLKTDSAEITLAEFSSQKDSIVSKWTKFDLSRLGSVQYVDFEVLVHSANPLSVPADFCMDNMVSSVNVSY